MGRETQPTNSWFPTFRKLAGTRVPIPWIWPWRTSAAQRRALLRLIAVATEENLQLAPLLESWAWDEWGGHQHRVRRLARLLQKGTPLAVAVEEVRGLLRDEDILAIRFGAQSGTLIASIRDILDESTKVPSDAAFRIRKQTFYFCVVLGLSIPIVAFMQIAVAPLIYRIWEDFDLEHVQPVEWSRWFNGFVERFWWVSVLALVIILWLTFSPRAAKFIQYAILGRFFRSWRELRSADVLQKLSVALSAGRPIPGALSTLARYHFDPTTRHKLLFVRNEAEQGADVWQSMATIGLLTPPEAKVLETAERLGNRPWALRQVASIKRRRTMRRLERVADLLMPAIVLTLGAFVLFQALTIFLPGIQLIQGLGN